MLTHDEYFKLHGTLTAERIEDLLDKAEILELAQDKWDSCLFPEDSSKLDEFTALKKCIENVPDDIRNSSGYQWIATDLESLESALDTHFEMLENFEEVLL